jgi:uncharacterized protein (TIGR03118 family)
MRRYARSAPLGALLLIAMAPAVRADLEVHQFNLVSDIAGLAPTLDPNLRNPWGTSSSPTGSPIWVSDQVTGVATLYNGAGVKQALTVTIPPPTGSTGNGAPTGQFFNTTASDFLLTPGNANTKAAFVFGSLNGTISGWNPGVNPTNAVLTVTTTGAAYTGLALVSSGGQNFIYAANARGTDGIGPHGIDVFNGSFQPVSLGAGAFAVPNLPAGLTPYNVQQINGTIYVTYSQRGTPGGFVAAFDTSGNFLHAVGANAPAGTLNAPWGLVIAPSSFGPFAGDLLVGNFGDGTIHAFDPTTGDLLGQILLADGTPFAVPGLWGLIRGNGGQGGNPNQIYFSAGINNEADGLFGTLQAVPEPGSIVLMGVGGLALIGLFRRQRRAA